MYDLKFNTVWLTSILPAQEPEAEDHIFKAIKWVQEQPSQPIETLTQTVQRELKREFSNRALGLTCTQRGRVRPKTSWIQIPYHL